MKLTDDPDIDYQWINNGLEVALANQVLEQLQRFSPSINIVIADIDVADGIVTFNSSGVNVLRARKEIAPGQYLESGYSFVIGGMNLISVSGLEIDPLAVTQPLTDVIADLITNGFSKDPVTGQQKTNSPMVLFPGGGDSSTACGGLLAKLGSTGLIQVNKISFDFFGGLVKIDNLMDALQVLKIAPRNNVIGWLAHAIAIGAPIAISNLLNFKVGAGGSEDSVISVNNDITSFPFQKGVVSAKGPGFSIVQATLDLEGFCLGKATDMVLAWVLPDLERVDIRAESGLVEDPIRVALGGTRDAHGVGMLNFLAQSSGPLTFDPIGKTNPDDITELLKNLIPDGEQLVGSTLPATITLPPGASLPAGCEARGDCIYEGGNSFFRMKTQWAPLSATLTFDEFRLQTLMPDLVSTWKMKPDPNEFATVDDDDGLLTGTKAGDTVTNLEVCIPLLTRREDDNGVKVVEGNGSLTAFKFEDRNGNGNLDPGEEGLNGGQMTLRRVDNGQTQSEQTMGSGAQAGRVTFGDLEPATYQVTEENRNGWTQTTGNPAATTIEPGDDQQVSSSPPSAPL